MIDVQRLWTTLLRTGIKESFVKLKNDFFMTIARTGTRPKGVSDLDEIFESEVFKLAPHFKDNVNKFIKDDDLFKYIHFISDDGSIMIEYFANINRPIPDELVDNTSKGNDDNSDESGFVDGMCTSSEVVKDNKNITCSIIFISESAHITPEKYPLLIKHELTHSLIYSLRVNIKDKYFENKKFLEDKSEEDATKWIENINYLGDILNKAGVTEVDDFHEFIAEFLMYEVLGTVKIKNPVVETTKTSKKNKRNPEYSRVTYRTITPYEVFLEVINDELTDGYKKAFTPFMEQLAPLYADYDAFLETIRS